MNVKPGDIAKIIDGGDCPENVGKLVYVDSNRVEYKAYDWLCETLQPMNGWNFRGKGAVPIGSMMQFRDCELKRIDPPPEETDTSNTTRRDTPVLAYRYAPARG